MVGNNLKLLRKKKKLSQEEVATALGLHRSTYSGYENGVASPNIENLVAISAYHQISLDDLLKNDFSQFTEADWLKVLNEFGNRASGKQLRILTSLVNEENEELIELIPEKARAGYTAGYEDLSFFETLPHFRLPFLSNDKKYRAFTIMGDSMPPLPSGTIVVGEFVQDWTMVSSGTPCIVITKNDGIVFKHFHNDIQAANRVLLSSANPLYEPYFVEVDEVLEVWKFRAYIATDLPEVQPDESQVSLALRTLQKEILLLRSKLN